VKAKELEEFLAFLEEEGLLTFEDKIELIHKGNVERLKTLAYLATIHIKKKLREDEISKYKEKKFKKILANLTRKGYSIFTCPRDDLTQENQEFEKIVGD